MSDEQVCIEEDCALPAKVRKRCGAHYQRWRRANMNTVSGPHDDPRMGFASRYTALLDEAPPGLISSAERALLIGIVFTAASAARGILPNTPEVRGVMLHNAVDAIIAEGAVG